MSELFMECVEEELEPWQKPAPEVHLIDDDEDDDDEPIFVGVLPNSRNDSKPDPPTLQCDSPKKQQTKPPASQPAVGPSQLMLPLNITGNAVSAVAPTLTTVTPQPVIVNNQGFIVTSPQLTNNSEFIASLGAQYPPGTKFAIVPAGQQQLFQQVTPGTVIPGVVHRPQVQKISNNIVTLSNVQSPTVYSTRPSLLQVNQATSTRAIVPINSNNRDQIAVKRVLPPQQVDSPEKKAKTEGGAEKVIEPVENGLSRKNCPKCQEEFVLQEALTAHMMNCVKAEGTNAFKRIMLVSDFYYGRYEGDGIKKEEKSSTTFKCQSCLKVLKNNIRFMNHMKHHLELEKQNSETWENYTTCQHCYRQYMTPFQLQCHIESAHSPIESSTNCKICELAFESEQVLLEHMKDNHKPGEMPYVCQVCNYRSSFFCEVERHFRSVHENTKDLLCPFCLKVLRSSHMYMQHYMKHQKKGIHRCGKCRLNFLTYKEKVEHRTQVHKTFRKPKALEGLPPGTKVTIRASLTGRTPVTSISSDRVGFIVGSDGVNSSPEFRPPVNISKTKTKTSAVAKERRPAACRSKINLLLKNTRADHGRHMCIECNTIVDDFFSHFPITSNCGACKYRTSCKVAIGNHMIRFHSAITKNRFIKMKNRNRSPRIKLTLVCLNCDLLVDASGGDLMSKHLTDRPNHVCKVIQDKDTKVQKCKEPKTRASWLLNHLMNTVTSTAAVQPVETSPEQAVASGSLPQVSDIKPQPAAMLSGGNEEKGDIAEGSAGEEKPLIHSSPTSLNAVVDPSAKSKGDSKIQGVQEASLECP